MGSVASCRKNVLYPPPVADTEYGQVIGMNVEIPNDVEKRIVKVFLGIPFAKPPVGDLRFEKPERPDKWAEPLMCKKYRDLSIQKILPWGSKSLGSEDCLYLNIVAPTWESKDPKGFPVMFYVHGGGYVIDGASNYHYLKISRMLVRHGVIVVTTQYRLGLLGYFCTNDDSCLGNYGLWDQYFALKFVSDNIVNFGGDPSNITIFGQSAGAVSCDLLSISPMSRDLIAKKICLGGNTETLWGVSARTVASEFCQKLVLKLGYKRKFTGPWNKQENEAMLEFLKQLPSNKFAMTLIGNKVIFDKFRLDVSPVVDGDILPLPPYILRRDAPIIPVICGITASEGLIFLSICQRVINDKMVKEFETKYEEIFGLLSNTAAEVITLKEVLHFYGITEMSRRDKPFLRKAIVQMMSDMINNIAWYNFMNIEKDRGCPTWSFVFDHHNPNILAGLKIMLPMNAATHGTELVYIFDHNMFKVPFRRTKLDYSVGLEVTTLLTNFSKYSNPNGDPDLPASYALNFEWEPVNDEYPQRHLVISSESELKETFNKNTLEKLSTSYRLLTHYFSDDKFWNKASC